MSELDPTVTYVLLGLVVAFVVACLLLILSRRGRKTGDLSQRSGPMAAPGPLVPAPGDEATARSIETLHGSAQPVPVVPGADRAAAPGLQEDRAPLRDLPEDLEAREEGSASVTPPARPHTIEEIQRHEGKALDAALANTKTSFFGRLKLVFSKKEVLKAGELDDIEEILYTSDLGPQTVQRLMGAVEEKLKKSGGSGFEAVRDALRGEMLEIFESLPSANGVSNGNGASNGGSNGHANGRSNGKTDATAGSHDPSAWDAERRLVETAGQDYIEGLEHLNIWTHKPAVLMIVGVNGAGKTTTIGKLARRIAQSGRKVLVAAGDTFRAAAGDQLKVWTERAQVEIFSPPGVSDPSAVAFDAIQTGQANGFDVVIIDTAGRLHTQKNLMEELKKMKRVMTKLLPTAPHEILLVLDANSGQNALVQAKEFHGALEVTGVVLTKLDGTAKGGVAVGLACELALPIKLIGVGEGIEDLRRFSSREFVDSII